MKVLGSQVRPGDTLVLKNGQHRKVVEILRMSTNRFGLEEVTLKWLHGSLRIMSSALYEILDREDAEVVT